MRKKIFSILLALICCMSIMQAQNIIKGQVLNSKGDKVDLATLSLRDSLQHFLGGVLSDASGSFAISLSPKAYYIECSHIGYKQVCIALKDLAAHRGNIILEDSANYINEVVVTGKKPLIRRELDRVILDAGRLNSAAMNFLDVLQVTPGVIVSEESIGMLGKNKISFYMNGRKLNMSDKELLTYLKTLSSTDLASVEVMTTPPAKYSAEGDAGIINFVTKKKVQDYLGGNLTNTLSVKEKVYDDLSANLQYNKNKVQAYMNLGGGFGDAFYKNVQTTEYPTELWERTQKMTKSNKFFNSTVGVDYKLNDNTSLGFIGGFLAIHPNAKYDVNTIKKVENTTIGEYATDRNAKRGNDRYNVNVHLDKSNIGKGGTLQVDADYLRYNVSDKELLQSAGEATLAYQNKTKRNIDIYSAKADMEFPLGNKGGIGYGASYYYTKTNSRVDYVENNLGMNLNDHFLYKEYVSAAYVEAMYRFSNKFTSKLGVRTEYTHTKGSSVYTDETYKKNYFKVFPTAYLGYAFNDNSALSLSATSRIVRPDYSDVNPFVVYEDANNCYSGNPQLQPSKLYTMSLGYTLGNLNLSCSYSYTDDGIGDWTTIDAKQQMVSSYKDNIMKTSLVTFEANYYFNKISWFDSYLRGCVLPSYSKALLGEEKATSNVVITFIYMNNNVYFNKAKTWSFNFWGQYNSREKYAVGETPGRYQTGCGLKGMLFNNKLIVGVSVMSLIANAQKYIVTSNGMTNTTKYSPYRVCKISLSYNFGKSLSSNNRKQSNSELLDRL